MNSLTKSIPSMRSRWDYLKYIIGQYAESVSDEIAQDAYLVVLADIEHLEQIIMDDDELHRYITGLIEENKRSKVEIQRMRQELTKSNMRHSLKSPSS